MALGTIDQYKQQAQAEYDPTYTNKVTQLKNNLASQLQALDSQKTGLTENYNKGVQTTNGNFDTQINNNNLGTQKNINNFSNTVLGRGLGRSTIATSGIGEMQNINTRVNNETNTKRSQSLDNLLSGYNAGLGDIESKKTLYNNNINDQLTSLASERDNSINALARQLYDSAYAKDFQERQFNAEQNYKAQQLASQKASSFNPSLSSNFNQEIGNMNGIINDNSLGIDDKIAKLQYGLSNLNGQSGKEADNLRSYIQSSLNSLLGKKKEQGTLASQYQQYNNARGGSSSTPANASSGNIFSKIASLFNGSTKNLGSYYTWK